MADKQTGDMLSETLLLLLLFDCVEEAGGHEGLRNSKEMRVSTVADMIYFDHLDTSKTMGGDLASRIQCCFRTQYTHDHLHQKRTFDGSWYI